MNLKNKYIAVIGAGESGVGAALLAQKLGAEVFVSDYGIIKENYKIPTMAYQVSGEYSLLTNGINKGFVNEDIILESLIGILELSMLH